MNVTKNFVRKSTLAVLALLCSTSASTNALAQCTPDSATSGSTVTCSATDTDGFSTTSNSITLNIDSGVDVSRNDGTNVIELHGSGGNTVNLNGSITTGTADAISLDPNSSANIINLNGTIQGTNGGAPLTAIDGGSGAETVLFNTGSNITGDIDLEGGADIVTFNGGTMNDDIFTGADIDVLTFNSGTFLGDIDTGAGDDDAVFNLSGITLDTSTGTFAPVYDGGVNTTAGDDLTFQGTGTVTAELRNWENIIIDAGAGNTVNLEGPINGCDTLTVTSGTGAVGAGGSAPCGAVLDQTSEGLDIDGEVINDDGDGITVLNSGNTIDIGPGAVVESTVDDAIDFHNGTGTNTLTVSGTLIPGNTSPGTSNPGEGIAIDAQTENGTPTNSNEIVTINPGAEILGDILLSGGDDTLIINGGTIGSPDGNGGTVIETISLTSPGSTSDVDTVIVAGGTNNEDIETGTDDDTALVTGGQIGDIELGIPTTADLGASGTDVDVATITGGIVDDITTGIDDDAVIVTGGTVNNITPGVASTTTTDDDLVVLSGGTLLGNVETGVDDDTVIITGGIGLPTGGTIDGGDENAPTAAITGSDTVANGDEIIFTDGNINLTQTVTDFELVTVDVDGTLNNTALPTNPSDINAAFPTNLINADTNATTATNDLEVFAPITTEQFDIVSGRVSMQTTGGVNTITTNGLNVENGGILESDGFNSDAINLNGGTLTVESGGILQPGNNGATVAYGDLNINNGNLDFQSGSTYNVDIEELVQTGGVNPQNIADLVTVTNGTTTIASGSTIDVVIDGNATDYSAGGFEWKVIDDANGITGDFTTITDSLNLSTPTAGQPLLWQQNRGDSYYLNITPDSFLASNPGGTPNQNAGLEYIDDVLDANVPGNTSHPSLIPIAAINGLPTVADRLNAMDQIGPETYDGYKTLGLNEARQVSGNIMDATNGGLLCDCTEDEGIAVWGKYLMSERDFGGHSPYLDQETSTSGFVVGADLPIMGGYDNELRVGAFLAMLSGETSVLNLDGESDTTGYGVYGNYDMGNIYVGASYGLYDNEYNTTRNMNFGTYSGIANADHEGSTSNLNVTAGLKNDLGRGLLLTGEGSLDYTTVTLDGFAETGATGANLQFGESETSSLYGKLQGKLSKPMVFSENFILTPQGRAGIGFDLNGDRNYGGAHFVNDGTPAGLGSQSFMDYKGDEDGILTYFLGGRVAATLSNSLELFAGGDIVMGDQEGFDANAGVRFGF